MRATFSPGMARSFSPAPSSVVSMSARAVESHAASACPVRFLKPNTATERRDLNPAGLTLFRIRSAPASRAKTRTTPIVTANRRQPAAASNVFLRAAAGRAITVSPVSAITASSILLNRSAGVRPRHRRMPASQRLSSSGTY